MALLACLITHQAKAQDAENIDNKSKGITITGGPVAVINFSNHSHSGISDGKSSMKTGFGIGGFLNLGISEHFSVQGELIINHKASRFQWQENDGEYRYWGMTIPIYAMYHLPLSNKGIITIGIGPYTDFGFRARFKNNGESVDLYSKTDYSGIPLMKDSDTGFGIKAGYELPCGLQINAEYRHSVSNVIDSNSSEVKMRPQVITLGLAYRFGK